MRPKGAMRVGQKKLKPLAKRFPKALVQVVFLFLVIVKSAKMCQKAAFGLHLTVACMSSGGLRSTALSNYTELDAR